MTMAMSFRCLIALEMVFILLIFQGSSTDFKKTHLMTYQMALNRKLVHICNNNVGKEPQEPPWEVIQDPESLWAIFGVLDRPDFLTSVYLERIKEYLVWGENERFRDVSFVFVWIYIQRMVNIADCLEIDYFTVHKLLALSSWITFKMDVETDYINAFRYSMDAFGMEMEELMEFEAIVLFKMDFNFFVGRSEV